MTQMVRAYVLANQAREVKAEHYAKAAREQLEARLTRAAEAAVEQAQEFDRICQMLEAVAADGKDGVEVLSITNANKDAFRMLGYDVRATQGGTYKILFDYPYAPKS